jgi:hypothetical protein
MKFKKGGCLSSVRMQKKEIITPIRPLLVKSKYIPLTEKGDCKKFFRHNVRICRNGISDADLVSKEQVCRNVFCTKHLLRMQRFWRQGLLALT